MIAERGTSELKLFTSGTISETESETRKFADFGDLLGQVLQCFECDMYLNRNFFMVLPKMFCNGNS